MSRLNAKNSGAFDLCSDLELYFFWVRTCSRFVSVSRKYPSLSSNELHLILWRYWPPTKRRPFTGEC